MSDINASIEEAFRDSYSLVVSRLSRQVRDIDLAAVRKRNPATIAYTVLFIAILGAGAYFLVVAKPPVAAATDSGPANNLHTDWSFEASAPFWRGEPATGVEIGTSTQVKGGGTRSLEIRTSVAHLVWRVYRNARSWSVLALLVGIGINGEIKKVGSNPTIVQ